MSESAKSFFPSISELNGPILVTGHTGFVGTWMVMVLEELKIPWVGFSKEPLEGSMFQRLDMMSKCDQEIGDLRNRDLLRRFLTEKNPSAIIHLAADALVLEAIKSPSSVMDNNFNSTLSLISEFENSTKIRRMLVSTTDKVYKNNKSGLTFTETDSLEGNEPYSESKVATEALIRGFNSILPDTRKVLVARAGNILGGGDFANDRLIPDIIRSKITGTEIDLRMPYATRPWQHVLDVIFGYLRFLEVSLVSDTLPTAINFGSLEASKSVEYIVHRMLQKGFIESHLVKFPPKNLFNPTALEKKTLDLNPLLATQTLDWTNIYSIDEALNSTLEWWTSYLEGGQDPLEITRTQIQEFFAQYLKSNNEDNKSGLSS